MSDFEIEVFVTTPTPEKKKKTSPSEFQLSAMSSPFTVLICHGFGHTPEHFQPLIEAFKAHNIEAHCPQLPTADLSKLNVGDIANPRFDLEPPANGYPQGDDDTKVVTEALRDLVEVREKRVLLLAHSAGGWVATQSAIPQLQVNGRQEKGLKAASVVFSTLVLSSSRLASPYTASSSQRTEASTYRHGCKYL